MESYEVVTKDGVEGIVESVSTSHTSEMQALIQFQNSRQFLVPVGLLVPQGEQRFLLPLTLAELTSKEKAVSTVSDDETMVVPVLEETLQVGKRTVEKEKVQIKKIVHEHPEIVSIDVVEEQVDVQRVPINQVVDSPASVRYEDDKVILPLHEEVLVVEKRLMLREELHIKKQKIINNLEKEVSVSSEEVKIERVSPGNHQETAP